MIVPDFSKRTDIRTYGIGYGCAMVLTGAAFAIVHWARLTSMTTLAMVFGLGLIQMIVHFWCFLHIRLRRSSRDTLGLLVFSALIVFLMTAGTLVVLFNLRPRMM